MRGVWRWGERMLVVAAALPGSQAGAGVLELIDFRRENEIAFGEAVNFVRPHGYFRFSPGKQDIRVMALLLRNCTHFIHERECLHEIRKFKRSGNVMAVHNRPLRHLRCESFQFFSGKRRHAAPARHACLASQFAQLTVTLPE
jgi:hypothetical protein